VQVHLAVKPPFTAWPLSTFPSGLDHLSSPSLPPYPYR